MKIRSKAPLRLGLAGGGTDVSPFSDTYGGYVLNATIDMYAYCILEPLQNGKIEFIAKDRNEIFTINEVNIIALNGTLDLHKGVYNRIIKDFNNGKSLSCRLITFSDAPAGSGLGSSSTMVVAIIKAFVEWLNLPLGEYDIAHLAYEIEREDIGLSGGKQDQYAATFGGFNFMEFYKEKVIVNPLRIKRWIKNELQASMVLYYTGQSRDSANIIDEQIKNTNKKKSISLDAMFKLKEKALEMKESILKGDISWFAQILRDSWLEKKKMAKVISNNNLDEIYEYAMQNGAISGKISGAGGGGFFMFIVNPEDKLQLIEAFEKKEGKVFDPNFVEEGTMAWTIK
ncbi:GHMP family kinase ATP-binding protein [Haliovirga abyssi]|uniref:Dehydrogenase n=1 Tax=Haliovirga abyssi TaxID=2996794 RepID=A0AAU9DG21_9FUSO|nr:dehydrogenase [Haliovirga abyssi]BDU51407.1 dehydrogenase [Haliovirga abyssi]